MTDETLSFSIETPTTPGMYRCKRPGTPGRGMLCDVDEWEDNGKMVLVVTIGQVDLRVDNTPYEWSQRLVPEHEAGD